MQPWPGALTIIELGTLRKPTRGLIRQNSRFYKRGDIILNSLR